MVLPYKVPLDGSPLALLIHDTVKYARLTDQVNIDPNGLFFSFPGIPPKTEPLPQVLTRLNIDPSTLVEWGFYVPEGVIATWDTIRLGEDNEKCVRALCRALKCNLCYWQKRSFPVWPPYAFIENFSPAL